MQTRNIEVCAQDRTSSEHLNYSTFTAASMEATSIIADTASGQLFYSKEPLSFWGGIELQSGTILDSTHSLYGTCIKGQILAIPHGRGSCSGSAALLELLFAGVAPSALIFETIDPILTLGVKVASKVFDISIPIIVVGSEIYQRMSICSHADISETQLRLYTKDDSLHNIALLNPEHIPLELTAADESILSGYKGEAAQFAIQLIVEFARFQNAPRLISVSKAHIDACIYTGPGILAFAQKLANMNATFAVPTTLNAISVDQRRWKTLGVDQRAAEQATALADSYISMGAQSSFTCAPYSLAFHPQMGEQIGWSESNAVIFANSVLGARTQKYPDFLDICIALTGRAPFSGCHTDEGRRPSIRIHVESFDHTDAANWALLGYMTGRISAYRTPLITGIETLSPTAADLKDLCAAFGTTSSASMLHIAGITPEAADIALPLGLPVVRLRDQEFVEARRLLTTAADRSVQLVSLGSPHLLLEEFAALSILCRGKQKSPDTDFIITTNQEIYGQAAFFGYLTIIEAFGGTVLTDTCWCMVQEPVIRQSVKNIMTNSAKYAHYGPSLVKKGMHFGNLAECVQTACCGHVDRLPIEVG